MESPGCLLTSCPLYARKVHKHVDKCSKVSITKVINESLRSGEYKTSVPEGECSGGQGNVAAERWAHLEAIPL